MGNIQVTAVQNVWENIKADIEAIDPNVQKKKKPFLSRLYHALEKTFAEIEKKAADGMINPFIDVNLLKYSENIPVYNVSSFENRPINVGFFPIGGNPINWGHILVAFKAINALNLDMVIFRVQGEIKYKKVPESDRVPIKDRHYVVKKIMENLSPLFRYTDIGSESGDEKEGFEHVLDFLKINPNVKIDVYDLLGVENKERVANYNKQFNDILKVHGKNISPNHRVFTAWIQRGEYGSVVTLEDLKESFEFFKKETENETSIGIKLVQDPDIDLNVTSTYYRNSHDAAFIPHFADEYAKAHGYYGHPPIDPRTGKPFDYSEDEMFKLHLRPITESIANKVVRLAERDKNKSIKVLGVDGPSGSGKTTIAYEVGKYLKARGYEYCVISLDIFLKDKEWRSAVEKVVVGEEISEKDIELIRDEITKVSANKTYYQEESFWEKSLVEKLFRELADFKKSEKESCIIEVPNAYMRGEKISRKDLKFEIKKGMIVIIDGKYAFEEKLQPIYDLKYRLNDNPDRTKAKFEMRTRTLSPNSADRQMVFYDMGLVPSYLKYAERTKECVDSIIEISTDEWKLVNLKDEEKEGLEA